MKEELKRSRFLFRNKWFTATIFTLLTCLFACSSQNNNALPKPRAYPKVEYPNKGYVSFDQSYCPFTSEIPKYAEIEKDEKFFDESPIHPCWFDIYFPDFDCRVHCSYYDINKENSLEKLHTDAFRMVLEHHQKATGINEEKYQRGDVNGFIFHLEGPTASPYQFYLTDSISSYLRGALYFNTQIKPDSLAPIYDFVTQDIRHFIDQFEWSK